MRLDTDVLLSPNYPRSILAAGGVQGATLLIDRGRARNACRSCGRR